MIRLTEDEIREIDDLWNTGYGCCRIATMLNRPISTIDGIVYRKTKTAVRVLGPRRKERRPANYNHISKPKLTPAQVREMRKLHASGRSVAELADKFGVSHSNAGDAISGRTWKHVR